MTTEILCNALGRAEKALRIDGLYLCLNSDASGSVRTFADEYVFKFDRFVELANWLRSPKTIAYDDEGMARE